MEGSVEGIALHDSVHPLAIDAPAKDQDISRFGSNDEMLIVDGAFHPAGLVRPLKVAFDRGSLLLKVKKFGRGGSVGVIAVERPFAGNIGGSGRRRGLLCPCSCMAEND